MKKKVVLATIFLAIIISFLTYANAVVYTDDNNPGSGGGGSSAGAGDGTSWEGAIKAIRVRVFRDGNEQYSGYYSLANSSNGCISSVTARVCQTTGYDYSSVNDSSSATCGTTDTITKLGCLVSENLNSTFEIRTYNGTYLDNYLRANSYEELKQVLEGMGYNNSNAQDSDVVIVEPATRVTCAGTYYFGTSTAMMKKNISYRGSSGNMCSADDNDYGTEEAPLIGYTFQNLFSSMSTALKISTNISFKDNNYTGFGYFKYNVSNIYDKYKIIYHGNGGTWNGEKSWSTEVTYGQQYTVEDNFFSRTGYNFIGWTTNSDGTDDGYNWTGWSGTWAFSNGDYGISDNTLNLYARWESNPFNIIYHGNGGTWNNQTSWQTEVTYGQQYTVEDNFFSRTGYNFIGWTTNSDGTDDGYNWTGWSGKWVYSNGEYGISDNTLNLYARWKPNAFNIIYHGNGGYDGFGHSKVYDYVVFDSWYTVKPGSIFDFKGHTFLGWTTNPNGKTDDGYNWTGWSGKWVYSNGEYGISDNTLNLYARWIDSCIVEFNQDSSIGNRLNLYKKYERKNLLNFAGKITAEEACTIYDTNYDSKESCLYAKKIDETTQNKFTNTNLSDYNDSITQNGKKSYCLTNFELDSEISINTPVNAGRIVYGTTEDVNIEPIIGRITKTCYIHKEDALSYGINYNNNILKEIFTVQNLYSNNIGSVLLNEKELSPSQPIHELTPIISTPVLYGEFYKVSASLSVLYKLNPIYVYMISGRECDTITNDGCKQIGYGVFSKFIDAQNSSTGLFNFKITRGSNSIFDFHKAGNTCEYTVEPEVIKYNNNDNGKLDLEFRIIDTNEPFNRNTMSNWSDGTDNSKNNDRVENYILNATNSYGIKKGETVKQPPKYTIILTPNIIQKIRDYNAIFPYDNYELSCDNNGENCQNLFIKNYKELGVIK